MQVPLLLYFFIFFFNAPATTEIYTLSLHDAFRSHFHTHSRIECGPGESESVRGKNGARGFARLQRDRKSTRLNSSHRCISYAVFCLKKKKTRLTTDR